jgi:hypothetical protein
MHIFSVRRIKMFVKEMRPQYLDSDNRMPICYQGVVKHSALFYSALV